MYLPAVKVSSGCAKNHAQLLWTLADCSVILTHRTKIPLLCKIGGTLMPELPVSPHIRHSLRTNSVALVRWVLISMLVGILVGLVGSLFHIVLEEAATLRTLHPWLLLCLPLAGLVIVALYHFAGMDNDQGTEFVISSIRNGKLVRLRTAPLIFISTALTHLTGGSAGREGAALQLGGSIAGKLGRMLHLDGRDLRVITMCGMSAGFSALFGTPLAAAVFAMEVESVGIMYYAALVPCLLGALTAQQVAIAWGIEPTAFALLDVPDTTMHVTVGLILLGVLCGVVSNLFCRLLRLAGDTYQNAFPNRYLRIAVGGAIVAAVSLLLGTSDYNGAGMDIIAQALTGQVRPFAFLLKALLTALTLGAGYKGGEIVPSLFLGATFGCLVSPLLGLSPAFGAAVGMVSVFCGVTNSPMTSILLAFELFGGEGLVLIALTIAVSYMTSGYHSLYHQQKIIYSKTKAKFIDTFSGDDSDE
jgi:H+/Cl- antiporter ClcA